MRRTSVPVSQPILQPHERSDSIASEDVLRKRAESAKRSFRSRKFLGGGASSASRDSRSSSVRKENPLQTKLQMVTEIFGRFKRQFEEGAAERKSRAGAWTADPAVGEEESYRTLDKEELIRQLLLRDIEIAKLKSAAALGLHKIEENKKGRA